jgi:hypothetical protein
LQSAADNKEAVVSATISKVRPTWPEWEGFAITPTGIETPRGFVSLNDLPLLQWKARFYDRAGRNMAAEIMGEKPADILPPVEEPTAPVAMRFTVIGEPA